MPKKVYVYDLNDNLIMEFETTQECADFFGKEREYINHKVKSEAKFRYNGEWYKLTRERIDK